MSNKLIPETDVLISTTIFLLKRSVVPYQFSVPRGRGINTKEFKKKLKGVFNSTDRNPIFTPYGPDIIGASDKEWWHIECKGAGSGKPQTQRNNFDRALSSVVSYFGINKNGFPRYTKNFNQYIGLALPNTQHYIRELTNRVNKKLRKVLNLWILIHDIDSEKIVPISPNSKYKESSIL